MARPNDPFWDRVEKLDDGRFNCKFCGYKFAAATSVTRIKWHLSGVQGLGVAICRQVPEDVQEAAFQAVHGGNKRHKGIASSSNFNDNAIPTTPQEQNNEVDNVAGDAGTTQAADRMGHPLGRSVEEFSRWLMEDDTENGTGGVVQPGAGASSSGGLTGNTNETPGDTLVMRSNHQRIYLCFLKGYLSFEHKTWAPYQTKMIDFTLPGPEVINWLNSYHGRCRDILASYLDESEMAWLNKATEPIGVRFLFLVAKDPLKK